MKKPFKMISFMLLVGLVYDMLDRKMAHAVIVHHPPKKEVAGTFSKKVEIPLPQQLKEAQSTKNNKSGSALSDNSQLFQPLSGAGSAVVTTSGNNDSVSNVSTGGMWLNVVGGHIVPVTLGGAALPLGINKWKKYRTAAQWAVELHRNYEALESLKKERITLTDKADSVILDKRNLEYQQKYIAATDAEKDQMKLDINEEVSDYQERLENNNDKINELERKIIKAEKNSGKNFEFTKNKINELQEELDVFDELKRGGVVLRFDDTERVTKIKQDILRLKKDMYSSKWKNGEYKNLSKDTQKQIEKLIQQRNVGERQISELDRIEREIEALDDPDEYLLGWDDFEGAGFDKKSYSIKELRSEKTYDTLKELKREKTMLEDGRPELNDKLDEFYGKNNFDEVRAFENPKAEYGLENLLSERNKIHEEYDSLRQAQQDYKMGFDYNMKKYVSLRDRVIAAELQSGQDYTMTDARIFELSLQRDQLLAGLKFRNLEEKARFERNSYPSMQQDSLRLDRYKSKYKNGKYKDLNEETQSKIKEILDGEEDSEDILDSALSINKKLKELDDILKDFPEEIKEVEEHFIDMDYLGDPTLKDFENKDNIDTIKEDLNEDLLEDDSIVNANHASNVNLIDLRKKISRYLDVDPIKEDPNEDLLEDDSIVNANHASNVNLIDLRKKISSSLSNGDKDDLRDLYSKIKGNTELTDAEKLRFSELLQNAQRALNINERNYIFEIYKMKLKDAKNPIQSDSKIQIKSQNSLKVEKPQETLAVGEEQEGLQIEKFPSVEASGFPENIVSNPSEIGANNSVEENSVLNEERVSVENANIVDIEASERLQMRAEAETLLEMLGG